MIIAPAELSIEEYHRGAPQWLSKTSLRDFKDHGPTWWKLAYIDRTLARPTPGGAEQGQAIDCYLTEGAVAFACRYAIKPDGMSFATKEGKAWREDQGDKQFLSQSDADILTDAVDAVRKLYCWQEIEAAQAQMTVRRHSPALGIGIQSRPDWIDTTKGIVWDLKKTRDLEIFGKQAIDLGYHLQAAIAGWCLAGNSTALDHAYLVAVEWERGARARVFEIPHDVLQHADREMRSIAAEIADRLKRNDWQESQQPHAYTLPIPGWMMAKLEAA